MVKRNPTGPRLRFSLESNSIQGTTTTDVNHCAPAEGGGGGDEEEDEDEDVGLATPRVADNLGRTEFRKVDPPAKHARGSTPPPNRKPAFGILKSPLKNAHSPIVRK